MGAIEQFVKQKYLNIETFRRSGVGVKTPVWFVQDGPHLYVNTLAASGKAKRIRNNGRVNVAPCKMDGRLNGAWVPAEAREITDADECRRVNHLLDKKYMLKKLFDLFGSRKRQRNIVLEIKLAG
jgi:uncharacterized protein